MSKVKYDDLFELLNEMSAGVYDRTRTIDSITNPKVKSIVSEESLAAISNGITDAISVASAAGIGAAIGGLSGVGTGAAATAFSGIGVAALSATGGTAAGAAAGSVVPVVGTAIGAVAGLAVGAFVTTRVQQSNNEKNERLYQEVLAKQNTEIRDLEIQLAELKRKYGKAVENNKRYKYLLGILVAHQDLKASLEKGNRQ